MDENAQIATQIVRYDGIFDWLSNFYPCAMVFEGMLFPTIENAYQAAKFPLEQRAIFQNCSPGRAKRLGKKKNLQEFYGLTFRPEWADPEFRKAIMKELIDYKFSYEHNPILAGRLVSTYPLQLIEGNYWHDYFWGVCDGKGENNLGKIQETRREELMDILE